jgi:dephospho-CoA kinase
MVGLVLAFSGALGAGKSKLTMALHDRLQWPRVSFGDEVRSFAVREGRDPNDRAVLQQLGQALVLTDREGFVRRVLNQRPTEGDLIVDGVRHVEILLELRKQVHPRTLKLIHINADSGIRQERLMERDQVERRVVARYDSDITEAQIARILPQYADLALDGSLPTSVLLAKVVDLERRLPAGY